MPRTGRLHGAARKNSINHQIRLAARPSGLPARSDDVFLDNVGGEILDPVLTRLARGARIVLTLTVAGLFLRLTTSFKLPLQTAHLLRAICYALLHLDDETMSGASVDARTSPGGIDTGPLTSQGEEPRSWT